MEETTSVGKAVSESVARIGTVFLIYLFVFIFAAFAGYLIGNCLLGGYVFIPMQPNQTHGAADSILFLCNILRSTMIQCGLLFLGGLLIRPMVIPCAVSFYRGFCMGCVLGMHKVSMLNTTHTSITLLLYFAATVFLFLFSSWAAVRLSSRIKPGSFHGMPYGRIYCSGFLCISGIVFLCYSIPFWIL